MSLEIRHGVLRRAGAAVLEPGRISAPAPVGIAVVGINGSGKSSLFMHLTDALRSSRGSASVEVGGGPASLSCMPQEPAFPAWLSVRDVARLYGLELDALCAWMPHLYLAEIARKRAHALSVGQRQALALALAIGRDADVTLLDEPFSALDFRRRMGALDLLAAHRAQGRSLLLSSQSAADLIDLCDHFVVLREGRYVFNGRRAELAVDGVERRLLELLT